MNKAYHIEITHEALGASFSQEALQAILEANLRQDRLSGQIGHHEYHFDHSAFAAGYSYMDLQRQIILLSLTVEEPSPAWQAFGRLTHAAQDFYAHSNYVRLWQAQNPELPPEQINPLDASLLASPRLVSGRIYYWEALCALPVIGRTFRHLLPRDAHAWMNLDSPEQGSLFAHALAAAKKRTHFEFNQMAQAIHRSLGNAGLARFAGRPEGS